MDTQDPLSVRIIKIRYGNESYQLIFGLVLGQNFEVRKSANLTFPFEITPFSQLI